MSENDNLQNADGKNEVETTKVDQTPEALTSDDTTSSNETTNETTSEAPLEAEQKEDANTTTEAHVETIEASNAVDAEDESNSERHVLEKKDYHSMDLNALASELESLLRNHKIQTISSLVNEIKTEFNAKFSALLEEKKEEFLNDGGNSIDFYYTNDAKKRFNIAYKTYRQNINAYYQEREQNLKENLSNRLAIIDEIKNLLNVEENINSTYKHFKELQEKWRNAGPIPRDKYNNAWNTYHHHVERFYDFLHLNRDLRDMDFKHNLDQKLKIIERAEELANDENTNRSFRELQVLHKLWKEELGPVAKEHREEIWERFSTATKIIHDKRQAYYADLDKAYEKNLERKEEIIANIEALNTDENSSHSVWQKRIKELESLRQDFFNAGKVPLKKNEATWAKFKDAVRTLNRSKNKFYKTLKKEQYDNLQKKRELIKVAEDNMDSEDFETITPLMKKIQSDWKKIGHVPRRDSDKVWKQFKSACNHYFDRLHNERKTENQHLYDALDKKTKLLDELKTLELPEDPKEAIAKLQTTIKDWKAIGHVPQNKRFIDAKFSKAIDAKFNQLNIEKDKLEMIRFESKLDSLVNAEDTRLLDNEQNFIRKKIDEVKSEINQLENNLQFFSNVKDDNPLVKEVHKNIDKHKKSLTVWQDKLKKVRNMYS